MKKTTLALGTAAGLALGGYALALPFVLDGADGSPHIPRLVESAEAARPDTPVAIEPSTYDPTRSLAPLVQAVEPAVVAIEVESTRAAPQVPEMFRNFLGAEPGPRRPVRGEGSGFVISPDGLLVTNHHVIDGADAITVRFSDGRRVDAQVVGSDPDNDVALLQLPGDEEWPHVSLGDSDGVQVGDWVVAIGNPLGLGSSVTTGIISGKSRNLGDNPFHAFLQTDAAINQGNSGGPLFTLDGRVVGMNTAIIQYANTVGFAVPARTLERIVEDLQDDGKVQRGYVGVALQPVDADLALATGLERPRGAMITDVMPGEAAEDAGLRPGDIVVSVEGTEVVDVNDTIRTIGERRPGETVKLGVFRDSKERTVKLTLGERPGQPGATPLPESVPDEEPAVDQLERLGVRLQPGTAVTSDGEGVRVLAVDPRGPAATKLRPGDQIVAANRVPVDAPATLAEVLSGAGDMVVLDVRRGPRRMFVAVPLD